MPSDMVQQFSYKPIILADFNDPFNQLDYILKNFKDFTDLIEMNYNYVLEHHLWLNRIKLMF